MNKVPTCLFKVNERGLRSADQENSFSTRRLINNTVSNLAGKLLSCNFPKPAMRATTQQFQSGRSENSATKALLNVQAKNKAVDILDIIPSDLQLEIFSRLKHECDQSSINYLKAFSCVSRATRQIAFQLLDKLKVSGVDLKKASQIFPCLKEINLLESVTFDQFEYLKKFGFLEKVILSPSCSGTQNLASIATLLPNLKGFEIQANEMSDEGFAQITQLKELKNLTIKTLAPVRNNCFFNLQKLENLEHLDLSRCNQIADQVFFQIGGLKKLKSLNLSSYKSSTLVFPFHFLGLKELEHLNLAQSGRITDEVFTQILELKKLKTLNLSSCKYISPNELFYLSGLENLEDLSVADGTQVNGRVFVQIGKLKNLKKLDLRSCPSLKEDGFYMLSELKNLESLNLNDCKVDRRVLFFISSLKKIKKLGLSGSEFRGGDLIFLKEFINLESLFLDNCEEITDKGIACLKNSLKLKELSLSENKKMNKSVFNLKMLEKLEKLDVSHNQRITNTVLFALQKYTHLEKLNLSHCENIRNKGLVYLNALKNLKKLELAGNVRINIQGLLKLKLQKLVDLNLISCPKITDSEIEQLLDVNNLPKIKRLGVAPPIEGAASSVTHDFISRHSNKIEFYYYVVYEQGSFYV